MINRLLVALFILHRSRCRLSVEGFPSFSSLLRQQSRHGTSLASASQKQQQQQQQQNEIKLNNAAVDSLDLYSLLVDKIGIYCGTRRGRQALSQLVEASQRPKRHSRWAQASSSSSFPTTGAESKRKWWLKGATAGGASLLRRPCQVPVVNTAQQATRRYEMVEQALLALSGSDAYNLTSVPPPLYGAGVASPFDLKEITVTDHDEWIELPLGEWTLEHILQAEYLIKWILEVFEWSQQPEIQNWCPLLAAMASSIAHESIMELYDEIKGTVQLIQVRNPFENGKKSYIFQLSEHLFKILTILRLKEKEYSEKFRKDPRAEKQWIAIKEELELKENEIKAGLVQAVASKLKVIDESFLCVAELDVLFACAAFAKRHAGQIPQVGSSGVIMVEQFVHPLLEANGCSAVPIDLRLSNRNGERCLVISGPNGGGKSVAMKSFGVVTMLAKWGIPIPSLAKQTPRVDIFDHVLVSIGDQQTLEEHQSTFTAQLSSYSTMIETVSKCENVDKSVLVLLDELSGGTEAKAGSAIAQSILENLLSNHYCRIVATTHFSQLKALSYENPDFGCATVLLENDGDDSIPSYQLQYDVIGESHALEAAKRCNPPLPATVLDRASALFTNAKDDSDAQFIRALQSSLQHQIQISHETNLKLERHEEDMAKCRKAMISLASAYDNHLARLQERVELCFKELKSEQRNSLELLGETLATLRVGRRKVQSERELLKDRGLKMVPHDYKFRNGDTVVIIADGEWDGMTGTVVTDETTATSNDVFVVPSYVPWEPSVLDGKPLVLQRHQVAVWDFDSVWDEDAENDYQSRSVQESKKRLGEILSSLEKPKVNSKETRKTTPTAKRPLSSRERKASRGKKKRN